MKKLFCLVTRFAPLLVLFSVSGMMLSPLLVDGSESPGQLEKVIKNVRANEELYWNLEVECAIDYQFEVKNSTVPNTPALILNYTSHSRSVFQEGLLREEFSQDVEQFDGKKNHRTGLLTCDGKTTWFVTRFDTTTKQVANMEHGRTLQPGYFRPHRWILEPYYTVGTPVSVWLQGGEALRKHPFAVQYQAENLYHTVTYEKEELKDDLESVKVRIEEGSEKPKKDPIGVVFVWFAKERNYLPIRLEAFEVKSSMEVPVRITSVSDWHEISPGIWLPFRSAEIGRERHELAKGKIVQLESTTKRITKAVPSPKYDVAFFANAGLEPGATVYEVKDRKITKSYVLGMDPTPTAVPPPPNYTWVWIALGVLAVIAAFLSWRLWRQRTANAAG
jgi:hypothetical protein